MVARARVMMLISALTTILAIAAVITVIGYRVFSQGGSVAPGGFEAMSGPSALPSSSGLGRRPLTAKTGVRVP